MQQFSCTWIKAHFVGHVPKLQLWFVAAARVLWCFLKTRITTIAVQLLHANVSLQFRSIQLLTLTDRTKCLIWLWWWLKATLSHLILSQETFVTEHYNHITKLHLCIYLKETLSFHIAQLQELNNCQGHILCTSITNTIIGIILLFLTVAHSST